MPKAGDSVRRRGSAPKSRAALTRVPPISETRPSRGDFPIVGIGAGVGGLAALTELVARLPASTGAAYLLRAEPLERESRLEELLQRKAHVRVQPVRQPLQLEPDHLYVLRTPAECEIDGRALRLIDRKPPADCSSIDRLFRSLAEARRERAVAISLSGSGADGALGLCRIREHGGLAIVQDRAELELRGGPGRSLPGVPTDLVVPLTAIPELVFRFLRTEPRLESASRCGEISADTAIFLNRVLAELRHRTGRDAAHYRRDLLLKRIACRMRVHGTREPNAYLERLIDPEEAEALQRDLLRVESTFFADAPAYDTLSRDVLPTLFAGKSYLDTIRVWCPGCGSGEEAYSLGMLLLEEAARHERPPGIQIFASDLDDHSLRVARHGLYPAGIALEVPAKRLRCHFQKEKGGYRARKALRDLCLFASHDVLLEPPFSRLDLISCRGLASQLEQRWWRCLTQLFHFALSPAGFLILGSGEHEEPPHAFRREVTAAGRIYRKLPGRQPLPLRELAQASTEQAAVPRATPPCCGTSLSARAQSSSTSDELRTTREELQSSREELQSANEELQAVHLEHRRTAGEIDRLTGDLQSVLAATDIATLFLDPALCIQRFTPRMANLFGVRDSDRGRRLSELLHREGYDELERAAAHVLAWGVPVERELSDPSGRWYHARILPYRNVAGESAGVVFTFVDITQQKRSEEDSRRAKEQLAAELAAMRRLHELVAILLVCPDREAAVDQVLDAVMEMTGAQSGHVQLRDSARDTLHLVAWRGLSEASRFAFQEIGRDHPSTSGAALRTRARVIVENAARADCSEALRAAARAEGYSGVQSTPLLSRTGELLGVLSTHHAEPFRPSEGDLRLLDLYVRQAADFIERQRSEEALRRSEARLVEENRHKDQYLAMLGHELRNPLAAIRNVAESLASQSVTDERLSRAYAVLGRQSLHMSHIIGGLLDVARIARGKLHLRLEVLDLRELLERVLEDNAAEFEARGLTLQVELLTQPLGVRGDEVRLVQVFNNLIGNALKFTPAPGTILVTLAVEEGAASIRIRDTGIGIRPEMLPRIFDSFQQEPRDLARTTGGLGLGLSLVKGLVHLHQGSVEAHSDGPGTGTELRIRLPYCSRSTSERPPEAPVVVPPRRILIVEDNADTAVMLRDVLEARLHAVTVVDNGAAALDFLRTQHADVVLCDLGLPSMSGYDVARSVRADPALRATPLVAITGYGQPEDRRRTAEAGFDEHLVKPVSQHVMGRLLARLTA